MIKEINLENFKGFKDLKNINLRPITILTGTNSCGKSSILQSILLLKQTIESKSLNQTLLLNGRFVHLGNFENIIYGKNKDRSVKIGLSYKVSKHEFSGSSQSGLPLNFLFRHILSDASFNLPNAEYFVNYYVWIKKNETIRTKTHIKPTIIEKFTLEINVKAATDNEFTESYFEGNIVNGENVYNCNWKLPDDNKITYKQGSEKFNIKFLNLVPNSFEINNPKLYNDNNNVGVYFYILNELMKHVFSSVSYVGPLREEPSRRYIYEDEVIEIGTKGENAAFIFLSENDRLINNAYFFDEEENKFYIERNLTLGKAVNVWNDLFNIKNFRPEHLQEVIRLNLDSSNSEDTRVNIADVGFGVSQIFPIILEGLRIKEGSTLLLEQPEIHLHPKVQMQLADYFISLAMSKKNLIIETHSEHIINRLVRRILEDNESILKDLVSIYFIEPSNEGSKFIPIEINEENGLINWPEDFFDQNATEQEKIILASINKRKAKTNG